VGTLKQLTVPAVNLWKQLTDTFLRDQRDWSGEGHISVVLFIVQQAGIDPATAETPGTASPLNYRLALPMTADDDGTTAEQRAKNVRPGWAPTRDDTAASFILRIAELFSGWDVGFRLDGTFYYLPRDHFTAPVLTFFRSRASNAVGPWIMGPVEERIQEPKSNVVQVFGGSQKSGKVLGSSILIDHASIKNPLAVNYVGRYRPTVVELGGAFSCAQLNWIARVVFDSLRRRRRFLRFTSAFVPTLKTGQVVSVEDFGNCRVRGFKARLRSVGDSFCDYEVERVENQF
jgi:hypothetical protein